MPMQDKMIPNKHSLTTFLKGLIEHLLGISFGSIGTAATVATALLDEGLSLSPDIFKQAINLW
jgi:hypothetical protein